MAAGLAIPATIVALFAAGSWTPEPSARTPVPWRQELPSWLTEVGQSSAFRREE
jgi:hypothetical protein